MWFLKEFSLLLHTLLSPLLSMSHFQRAPPLRTRHLRLCGQEQPRAEHHQGRPGSGEAGDTRRWEAGAEAWWSASILMSTLCCSLIQQVVKRSNQWWLVRHRGDEGSVPHKVLELMSSSTPLMSSSTPVDDQQVSPAGEPSSCVESSFTPFAFRYSGTPAGPPPWT